METEEIILCLLMLGCFCLFALLLTAGLLRPPGTEAGLSRPGWISTVTVVVSVHVLSIWDMWSILEYYGICGVYWNIMGYVEYVEYT